MNDVMVDRLDVIERGLEAEVAECEEAVAAAELLIATAARICPTDVLESTISVLRRLRGELGACKMRAVTARGRLAHSRVCASRMGDPV